MSRRNFSFFFLLTASLVAVVAVSFAAVGVGFRSAVSDLLFASLDASLLERTEAIQSAINGFETAVPSTDRNPDAFIQFIQDMVADPAHDDLSVGTFIQIHDSRGKLIVSNRDAVPDGLTAVPIGKPATLSVTYQSGAVFPMRFIRSPAPQRKPLELVISVGRQIDVIADAENRLSAVFIRVLVPAVLIISLILFGVSRWLTRPLTRLVREIGLVEADNLHRQVGVPSNIQEIGELTGQFNRMLQRLEASFAAQKRFVADVSHQFRTPLAVMAGQIQTQLSQTRSAEDYRATMESNLEEIRQLDHLLDILLNLARLEVRDPRDRQPTRLDGLARQVVEDFALVAESRRCAVDCRFQPTPPTLLDPNLIRQALVNLFDNATKYAGRDGAASAAVRLETGVGPAGGKGRELVWFRTTNWGPTVPPEELALLGERFFRGRGNTREGVGLGLSLVKLVAELHQGRLDVASDAENGTSFTLSIPLA